MKAAFNKHYNHDQAGSLNFAGSGSILIMSLLTPFSVKYFQ